MLERVGPRGPPGPAGAPGRPGPPGPPGPPGENLICNIYDFLLLEVTPELEQECIYLMLASLDPRGSALTSVKTSSDGLVFEFNLSAMSFTPTDIKIMLVKLVDESLSAKKGEVKQELVIKEEMARVIYKSPLPSEGKYLCSINYVQ